MILGMLCLLYESALNLALPRASRGPGVQARVQKLLHLIGSSFVTSERKKFSPIITRRLHDILQS